MNRKPFDRSDFIACVAIVIAVLLLVRPSTLPVVSAQDANANKKINTNTSAPKKTPAKKPVAKKPTPKTSTTANSNISNASNAAADERTYWESIRNSMDPADFQAYLKKYPMGTYTTLATNRLNGLEEAKRQAAATAEERKKQAAASTEAERKKQMAASAEAERKKQDAARALLPKPIRNSKGIEMIWIPPGGYDMGSNNGIDEKPVHRVTISQGFFMGKYEVTQGQWHAVMGTNPSYFKGDDNLPVEQITWSDAEQFINKLNKSNDGYQYRLPSEAEWEYACRAGATGDYYAQDVADIAWYRVNSGSKTHKVGGKQANAFGLYDMAGNVEEWCQDWYADSYDTAPTDGSARLSGVEMQDRVLRGGSWDSDASKLRSAIRSQSTPFVDFRLNDRGFRLVAVVRTQ